MPFLSGGHLWLILILLVVVLIIWGPGKLPDVGAGMGRAIREFKKASNDTKEGFMNSASSDSSRAEAPPTVAPPAVAPPVAAVPPVVTPPAEPAPSRDDAASRPAPISEEHRVSS